LKTITIKKEAVEKVLYFNPWIYRREIKYMPKSIIPGELVQVLTPDGKFLAIGYANPKSNITVRILSFEKRNINTAGIEVFRKEIVDSLIEIIRPFGIYDKSDPKVRDKEGLFTENKVIYGEVPERVLIKENGVRFYAYLKEGQKTGAFLDQRKNRKIVSDYVEKGFRVLDVFSNIGGFGIYAYTKGAEFVKFVDISEKVVNQLKENIELNLVKNYEIVNEDAFKFMKNEMKKKEQYDLIVLDPPPFAKTKHEKQGALRGFKYLILTGLKLLRKNGLMAVFSCSHHVSLEDLKRTALDASRDTKFRVEILEHMFQDIDHSYILNIPNSLYSTFIRLL